VENEVYLRMNIFYENFGNLLEIVLSLVGRNFVIRTDAMGMKFIFERGGPRAESKRAVRRAEGFALRVCNFDFEMEHIKGEDNVADAPSRLVFDDRQEIYPSEIGHEWPNTIAVINEDEDDYDIEHVTLQDLKEESIKDPTIQVLKQQLEKAGDELWPKEIVWYRQRQHEMRMVGDLLIIENRVLIPESLQKKLIEITHRGHPGVSTMVGALKERVWWLNMKGDIMKFINECEKCKVSKKPHNPTPMQMTNFPEEVWSKLAIDFYGPLKSFGDIYVLVIADYFSRFIVTKIVKSTSAITVIQALKEVFETYGNCEILKMDNGPPFQSSAFLKFLRNRGITAEHSTPLCPQQNGLVERYMRILNSIASISTSRKEFEKLLKERIEMHNVAPNRMTNKAPRDLMFGRKLRDQIPFVGSAEVYGDENEYLEMKERNDRIRYRAKEVEDRKRNAKEMEIDVGDTVLISREKKKKTESRLLPAEATVESVRGGDMTLRFAGGQTLDRNVTKVRKVIPSTETLAEDEKMKQIEEVEENSGAYLPDRMEVDDDEQEENRQETSAAFRRSERIKQRKEKLSQINHHIYQLENENSSDDDWNDLLTKIYRDEKSKELEKLRDQLEALRDSEDSENDASMKGDWSD
jgi:transposase InsO family protein